MNIVYFWRTSMRMLYAFMMTTQVDNAQHVWALSSTQASEYGMRCIKLSLNYSSLTANLLHMPIVHAFPASSRVPGGQPRRSRKADGRGMGWDTWLLAGESPSLWSVRWRRKERKQMKRRREK